MAEERESTRHLVRQTAGGCARWTAAGAGDAFFAAGAGVPLGDDGAFDGDFVVAVDSLVDGGGDVAGCAFEGCDFDTDAAELDDDAGAFADAVSFEDPAAPQLAVATRPARVSAQSPDLCKVLGRSGRRMTRRRCMWAS